MTAKRLAEIRAYVEYRRDYSEACRMAMELLAELDRRGDVVARGCGAEPKQSGKMSSTGDD